MAFKSKIEWTESSWNPVTGCTKESLGCQNCYAERLAKRLKNMGLKKYENGFKVTIHPKSLNEPLNWKKPQIIFVVSMGDLFHKDVPDDFIEKVFEVMNKAYWHTFQVLTKRSERLLEISKKVKWTDNIWAGVTVEHEKYLYRLNHLKKIPAKIKFVSMEPLLSDMPYIDFDGIDWVVVGGESGPGARSIEPDWVRNIRNMCLEQDIHFFFKQWGGFNKKKNGRILDGRTWDDMPEINTKIERLPV
ncbi:phage protein Gp37/Gp68 [Marinitoga sp. 1135]|uniref:DUF5131 family protein n=1 Tax=Marinitoga sp. 1135 TaxID=1643333 RepID=UPI001586BE8E|nr:phage Gp37/Gp68 family protein [Marinitoga sp. 1135]NUU94789.1 phage protein Gp37/Gp68 [Marinitoga sp. 1135]